MTDGRFDVHLCLSVCVCPCVAALSLPMVLQHFPCFIATQHDITPAIQRVLGPCEGQQQAMTPTQSQIRLLPVDKSGGDSDATQRLTKAFLRMLVMCVHHQNVRSGRKISVALRSLSTPSRRPLATYDSLLNLLLLDFLTPMVLASMSDRSTHQEGGYPSRVDWWIEGLVTSESLAVF
ncbi:hypothetical protein TcWFU_004048 [Taenia crassiceps]|uniref:Uncharacterized protein n=1 Tax=Taenia crassiceps TaxID=6207 RepID=A0ABR4Q055_9CEST